MSEDLEELGGAFLPPGTRISERYVVLRLLGEGGMGQVYEVEHEAIGRHFALKLLNISPCTEELLRRFRREARALGRVTSTRVAQVTDFGFEPRLGPYYVMELLDGETLEERLERDHYLPAAQAIPVAIDLCEALNEVHAAGIIHRDLKPSNVGLNKGGSPRVKLLDFGLATASDGAFFERITRSQEVVGSLPYMAPERFYNAELTHSVDLYALGVVLYETLCGQLPYDGQSAAILINQHINGQPPPFQQTAPELDIPPALEAIVNRLLDKDPSERFASAAAVGRALYAATIDAPLPTLADFGNGVGLSSTLFNEGEGHSVLEDIGRRSSPTASEPIEVAEAVAAAENAAQEPAQAATKAATPTPGSGAPDTDPDYPPNGHTPSEEPSQEKGPIPTSKVPDRAQPSTPPAGWAAESTPSDAPVAATMASIDELPPIDGENWDTDKVPVAGFERSRRWIRVLLFALIAIAGSTIVGVVTFYLVQDNSRRPPPDSRPAIEVAAPPAKQPPVKASSPPAPQSPQGPEPQLPSTSSGPRTSSVGVAADHQETTPPSGPISPPNPGNVTPQPPVAPTHNPPPTPPRPPPSPPSIEIVRPPPQPPEPRPRPNNRPWRGEIIEDP